MNNTNATTKYGFSYLRFSSSAQKGNSSVDRQSPIAERVCTEQGWIYKPEFNAANLGVSAFKGDNRKTIESIIKARKENRIPENSCLIMESLDRASRLELDDAMQLIRSILKSGLEIYTDMNKRHLTKASLNSATDVMLMAVELDAAYQYSKRISGRSIGGIKKGLTAIASGKKHYFGGCMPVHITGITNSGDWIIDQDRLKVVKRIFKECLDGKSMNQIAIGLSLDAKNGKIIGGLKRRKNMPKQWERATVQSVLRNTAVTGNWTFKGKVYENYLPCVIDQKQFDLVQAKLKHNKTLRGGSSNNKNVNNLFRGLCFCKHCKGIVGIASVNTWDSGNTYTYIGCTNATRHKDICKAKKRLNRLHIEKSIFDHCLGMSPSEFLTSDSQTSLGEQEEVQASLVAVEKKIKTVVAMLDNDGIALEEIKERLKALQGQRSDLEKQLKELQTKSNVNSSLPNQVNDFFKLVNNGDLNNQETRKRLVNILPSIIKRIEFDLMEYPDFDVTLTNGEQWSYTGSIEEEGYKADKHGKLKPLYSIHKPTQWKP